MIEGSEKKKQRRTGFRCKQFFVAHDQCAMKVGTDSLILGSWCRVSCSKHILDIGSGSGILSLMLAQKTGETSQIMGIDIDEPAVRQAEENAASSILGNKLSFVHGDVNTFRSSSKFDCIISNPPFFALSEGASINMSPTRRQARQSSSLSYEQLIRSVDGLLSDNGQFCLILPQELVEHVESLAKPLGLVCTGRLKVRSTSHAPFIRQCLCFSYTVPECMSDDQLTIYNDDKSYTEDYRKLCKDFYLAF